MDLFKMLQNLDSLLLIAKNNMLKKIILTVTNCKKFKDEGLFKKYLINNMIDVCQKIQLKSRAL